MTFELALQIAKRHRDLEMAPSIDNPDEYVVIGQMGDYLSAFNKLKVDAKYSPADYTEIFLELDKLPTIIKHMEIAQGEHAGKKVFHTS